MAIRPYFLLPWKFNPALSKHSDHMVKSAQLSAALLMVASSLAACSQPAKPPALVIGAPYAADSGTVLIHCGALIDGVSDDIAGPTYVLVEDGRIKLLALLCRFQPRRDSVRVPDQKFRSVDNRRIADTAQGLKTPYDRSRERLFDGTLFVHIVTRCAIVEILLHQQYLRTGSLKFDDSRRAQLAAVERKIVRADASRE